MRSLVLVLALVLGAAAPALAESRSALVAVVENNDSISRGGGSSFLRALDALGEPAYALLMKRSAKRYWDHVEVLTDEAATFTAFAAKLRELDEKGYTIDVVLDIHGSSKFSDLGNRTSSGPDRLYFQGNPVTREMVAALAKPRKLRLNAVYMVSCWGSRFNDAWLEAGARAVNGSRELNYYVLLSPLVFIRSFGRGADLETASKKAYDAEAGVLDNAVVDRALAGTYGDRDVRRIQGARSSERVQAGEPGVRAACVREPGGAVLH